MEKRPNYLVKIVGNDFDKDGMSITIDVEDQCRGCMVFACDGENVQSRMYGESTLADLASIIYMMKKELGRDEFDIAAEVADRMLEVLEDGAAAVDEREGVPELSGQDGGLQGDVHGSCGEKDHANADVS